MKLLHTNALKFYMNQIYNFLNQFHVQTDGVAKKSLSGIDVRFFLIIL